MDQSETHVAPRKGMSFTTKSMLGLGLGFGCGVVAHAWSDAPLREIAHALEPVGLLWVNALRMLVIPLVLSNLVLGIAGSQDGRVVGRIGAFSFALFIGFLLLGTAFTLAVVPPTLRFTAFDPTSLGALAGGAQTAAPDVAPMSFSDWIFGLVPKNPFGAAADGAILPLLIFTVPFAFAVSTISEKPRAAFLEFVRAVCEAMFVFLGWILWFAPFAVFALTFAVGSRAGFESVQAVGFFVVLVSVLLAAFTVILYPVTSLVGRIGLSRFAKGVLPSQTVAVGTRSSLATLPALLRGAEQRLGIGPAVSGLVLPLAVSTFKVNTAVSSTTKFLFLAVVYGIDLSPERVTTFIVTSLLLSFASPGIPTAPGSVSRLPAYLAAGIPLEGVMILSAVDAIPDIFKTVVNVTADMSVTVIVARWLGMKPAEAPPAVSGAERPVPPPA